VVVGGFSFYQRAEIKDALAYLKVLISPQDSISLLRVINTPARGIGRTTIDQLEQYALARELSLWSALDRMLREKEPFPARAEASLAAFYRMIEELRADVETKPAVDTLRGVLDRTGYRQMLEEQGTEEAQARLANLDELLNAAADASERGEGIRDFLDHAALVSDADSVDERAPVSLLTMHNAKGLEFPVVFIAGLEEGLFPHSRSLDSGGAMEEERRLCYVGMTRAQTKLYLSWALYRRRYGGGQREASIRSRFLKEVPANLVEKMRADQGQVDLIAERYEVRETVRRNLYTGKTYNSVENIRQFFAEKGMPAPRGLEAPPAAPKPATPAPSRTAKKVRPGSTIEHAKYGRGTVLRLEGSGADAKVTVSFPGYGLKKLVAKYAGIEIE
jgi:DNA helicase-2/ATP-dependent DNA helicase PcrA